MERGWWGRLALVLGLTVLSAAYVYPSIVNLDTAKSNFPIKDKITLGLDLQGGVYLVLGVDFNKVFKENLDRQMVSLQERLKEKSLVAKSVKVLTQANNPQIPADDPRLLVEFDADKKSKIEQIIKDEYQYLRFTADQPASFELGLSSVHRGYIRERTIDQSKEVIRNRIDEFGVAEPTIAAQGNDRIVVELPGVAEIERAKSLIGRTAKLEWKMVDDKAMAPGELVAMVEEIEKVNSITYNEGEKFSAYVAKINEFAASKIPADHEISFERVSRPDGTTARVPLLLKSKSELTGEDLLDAYVSFNQEDRSPEVAFALNPKGASIFDRLTGEHVGERLAIILDSTIYSAPVIRTRIGGGRGVITLGTGDQQSLMKEAKDLAIVLRAGALPAQLEFLEQRVVGPSLGQDSIRSGATAAVIGALGVFALISVFYKVSGLIATLSLMINVLFVVSILVGLKATLTLPGIAGIGLTVGIAVDSNVVIYERIREELRSGKSVVAAIEAGFQKAFRTIVDANVTNAAAAVVLLNFGTGAIKGFAVTLLIGIITTLFTAVVVCRMMFDLYGRRLEARQAKTLSI